ncbi:FMN-binding protein [bacterium SCSIO 12741]|nr:FMN-binding protein [bacterium SCSIO 12741]
MVSLRTCGWVSVVAVLLALTSCDSPDSNLFGKWRVESKYYKATYHIVEDEGKIEGRVLYYNDGTTLIQEEGKPSKFLFRDLKEQDGVYVDGISGATNTTNKHWSLSLKHKDTIEAREHFGDQSSSEIWVRIHENNED